MVRGSIESGYYWPDALIRGSVHGLELYRQELQELQEKAKQIKREKEKNMRYLYHVYVVDPKAGALVHDRIVVAKDQAQAMLKAGFLDKIRDNLEDYDIIIKVIGEVRAKKETQKVKVVTED